MSRRDRSYERYKQYRRNRYQYEVEQVAFPVGVIILGALLIQYWRVVVILAVIGLSFVIYGAVRKGRIMKSTEKGFVNKNNQRNEGCTHEAGTDYGQKFYYMACLHCGHHYFANGTDIWQRKCPNCQGGKP